VEPTTPPRPSRRHGTPDRPFAGQGLEPMAWGGVGAGYRAAKPSFAPFPRGDAQGKGRKRHASHPDASSERFRHASAMEPARSTHGRNRPAMASRRISEGAGSDQSHSTTHLGLWWTWILTRTDPQLPGNEESSPMVSNPQTPAVPSTDPVNGWEGLQLSKATPHRSGGGSDSRAETLRDRRPTAHRLARPRGSARIETLPSTLQARPLPS
jgi:hypothetical protein